MAGSRSPTMPMPLDICAQCGDAAKHPAIPGPAAKYGSARDDRTHADDFEGRGRNAFESADLIVVPARVGRSAPVDRIGSGLPARASIDGVRVEEFVELPVVAIDDEDVTIAVRRRSALDRGIGWNGIGTGIALRRVVEADRHFSAAFRIRRPRFTVPTSSARFSPDRQKRAGGGRPVPMRLARSRSARQLAGSSTGQVFDAPS